MYFTRNSCLRYFSQQIFLCLKFYSLRKINVSKNSSCYRSVECFVNVWIIYVTERPPNNLIRQKFFARFSIFSGSEWLIPFNISFFIKLAIYEREWVIQSLKKSKNQQKKLVTRNTKIFGEQNIRVSFLILTNRNCLCSRTCF